MRTQTHLAILIAALAVASSAAAAASNTSSSSSSSAAAAPSGGGGSSSSAPSGGGGGHASAGGAAASGGGHGGWSGGGGSAAGGFSGGRAGAVGAEHGGYSMIGVGTRASHPSAAVAEHAAQAAETGNHIPATPESEVTTSGPGTRSAATAVRLGAATVRTASDKHPPTYPRIPRYVLIHTIGGCGRNPNDPCEQASSALAPQAPYCFGAIDDSFPWANPECPRALKRRPRS